MNWQFSQPKLIFVSGIGTPRGPFPAFERQGLVSRARDKVLGDSLQMGRPFALHTVLMDAGRNVVTELSEPEHYYT